MGVHLSPALAKFNEGFAIVMRKASGIICLAVRLISIYLYGLLTHVQLGIWFVSS